MGQCPVKQLLIHFNARTLTSAKISIIKLVKWFFYEIYNEIPTSLMDNFDFDICLLMQREIYRCVASKENRRTINTVYSVKNDAKVKILSLFKICHTVTWNSWNWTGKMSEFVPFQVSAHRLSNNNLMSGEFPHYSNTISGADIRGFF